MAWFSNLVDAWFGPRDWAVFRVRDDEANTGWSFFATRYAGGGTPKGWALIRDGLRRGAAYRMARRLRLKSDDTPTELF